MGSHVGKLLVPITGFGSLEFTVNMITHYLVRRKRTLLPHSPSASKVDLETQHQFAQLQILTRGHSANKQLLTDWEQIL